jgi:serine/threonine protein kinase
VTDHPDRVADYDIDELESRASTGWFYLARPPARLGLSVERVVLKVIDSSGLALERFGRELRAFAAVPSLHLVRILDAGQQENRFFYSMEWLPLGSLATARPDRSAVRLAVAGAARGAHALHEAGIAHRDIQPRNVLVTEGGGKLRDLGLARLADPQASMSTMPSEEAVAFVDPALIKGEGPSRASDLYALGATLHHALCGRSVFPELPRDLSGTCCAMGPRSTR